MAKSFVKSTNVGGTVKWRRFLGVFETVSQWVGWALPTAAGRGGQCPPYGCEPASSIPSLRGINQSFTERRGGNVGDLETATGLGGAGVRHKRAVQGIIGRLFARRG